MLFITIPLYVRRMVMKSIMPAGSSGGLA